MRWQWRVHGGDREDASEETTNLIRLDARLAEYLFPCGGGRDVEEADGRVGWLGHLGRHWSPVVCISRDWVKMGVRVHWEPWACLVMSLGSRCRENFINGPGWVLLGRWCQVPELSLVDGSCWGGPWGFLEDEVKLGAEGYREMVQRHPFLASV